MTGLVFLLVLLVSNRSPFRRKYSQTPMLPPSSGYNKGKSRWANVPQHFPVSSMKAIPPYKLNSIPTIQYEFGKETIAEKQTRLARLAEVKGNFTHAWNGYKDHAWLKDEVMPLSGGSHDPFGGWAATLVDSLGLLSSLSLL